MSPSLWTAAAVATRALGLHMPNCCWLAFVWLIEMQGEVRLCQLNMVRHVGETVVYQQW